MGTAESLELFYSHGGCQYLRVLLVQRWLLYPNVPQAARVMFMTVMSQGEQSLSALLDRPCIFLELLSVSWFSGLEKKKTARGPEHHHMYLPTLPVPIQWCPSGGCHCARNTQVWEGFQKWTHGLPSARSSLQARRMQPYRCGEVVLRSD